MGARWVEPIDDAMDAKQFVDLLLPRLDDSEVIAMFSLLEAPEMGLSELGEHLGMSRNRVATVKGKLFKKARYLRKQLENGRGGAMIRQATPKEQEEFNVRHGSHLVDDNTPWLGDVEVRLKSELEIPLNNRPHRFGPGTVSVTEEVAKLLVAQGARMRSMMLGNVAIRVEDEDE